jgi:alkanesulfonate monooxygenase SsuD/methylene tetrahydromethanopterin reductase-like flavin-dependent oxidoreductase (luciferase family)
MPRNSVVLCAPTGAARTSFRWVEHYSEDSALCPDHFVYLALPAALTKRIGLMRGAVIAPRNLQLRRVAEKVALLDPLCEVRLMLGLGRGLSRRAYA